MCGNEFKRIFKEQESTEAMKIIDLIKNKEF